MPRTRSASPLLTLPALAVLLTSCANAPTSSVPSAQLSPPIPAQIPPLPPQARQPPAPELCSPTCSEGLRRRLQNWLP